MTIDKPSITSSNWRIQYGTDNYEQKELSDSLIVPFNSLPVILIILKYK